jgi:hypothetical protein
VAALAGRHWCDQPCGAEIGQGARPDAFEEALLQGQRMMMQGGNRQPDLVHPGEDGALAIKSDRIECRPPEAATLGAIGHADLPFGQCPERGIPACVARARRVAGRAVDEADVLAGHRIFVAPGQIEHPARDGGKVRRQGHEAVIAVDADEGVRIWDGVGKRRKIAA